MRQLAASVVVFVVAVATGCTGAGSDDQRSAVSEATDEVTSSTSSSAEDAPAAEGPDTSAVGSTTSEDLDGAQDSGTAVAGIAAVDVIEATRESGSASGAARIWESVADPVEGHGTSGLEETALDFVVEYDFTNERARLSWVFPAFDDFADSEPTAVEARLLDGIWYFRDGSWLCPLCGFDDGDEPLPSDEWIPFPSQVPDLFDFDGTSVTGQLGWLGLVADLDVDLAFAEQEEYVAELPVDDVTPLLGEFSPELQGDHVRVAVEVDSTLRLLRLAVTFRADDRDRLVEVNLGGHDDLVAIDPVASEDVYGW